VVELKLPIVDVDLWRHSLDPKLLDQWQAYFVLRNREAMAAARRARRADERGSRRYLTHDEMHSRASRYT